MSRASEAASRKSDEQNNSGLQITEASYDDINRQSLFSAYQKTIKVCGTPGKPLKSLAN